MKPSITLVNAKTGRKNTFKANKKGVIRIRAGVYRLPEPLYVGKCIVLSGETPKFEIRDNTFTF